MKQTDDQRPNAYSEVVKASPQACPANHVREHGEGEDPPGTRNQKLLRPPAPEISRTNVNKDTDVSLRAEGANEPAKTGFEKPVRIGS